MTTGDGIQVEVERVGDGVLITFSTGATIWFDKVDDARLFATNIMLVCAFGADQLENVPTSPTEETT